MEDNFENKVYNVFKSVGCTESKCKEVINLISDDDLSCISGGKSEARKEIVKKILSLGLMATSVCPTVLFNNNIYASNTLNSSNEESVNENILKKNQEQNLDNNTSINLKPEIIKSSENLINKKIENKNNEKKIFQNNTEFSKDKTKHGYISVNNDNKNQAIKYYNRNSRWNTIKKAVIGTGTIIGIPTLGWLLYNNFASTNNRNTGSSTSNNGNITVQNLVNDLNSSIRNIHEILNAQDICQNIIELHSGEYKFDMSDMVNGSQQDLMSSRIGIKNNLDTFSTFFYKVICDWNELNNKLNSFDHSIMFDISNDKPVSFQDFISHVEKFRVSGEYSYELKEFYKIIENMKDIKQTRKWPSRKSVLDLKIVFCNKKLHVNAQYSDSDDNVGDIDDIEYDDYKLNSNLADLLKQFKEYYSQILSYVAPGIKSNSTENILNIIKEFDTNFDNFAKSKNWKGLIGLKKYECNLSDKNDPFFVCCNSYEKVVKLINLNHVGTEENRKNINSDPTEFYQYFKKIVRPAVESIKKILELYNTVNSIQESYGNSNVRKQIGESSEKLNDCTKELYKNGYKNDENFKKFKDTREKIQASLDLTNYLS